MGNIMIRSIITSLLFGIPLFATVINVPADQTTIQAGINATVPKYFDDLHTRYYAQLYK